MSALTYGSRIAASLEMRSAEVLNEQRQKIAGLASRIAALHYLGKFWQRCRQCAAGGIYHALPGLWRTRAPDPKPCWPLRHKPQSRYSLRAGHFVLS
jgi:hypothetical protein